MGRERKSTVPAGLGDRRTSAFGQERSLRTYPPKRAFSSRVLSTCPIAGLPFPRRKPLQRQFRIRWSCSLLGLRHAGGGTQGESTGCKCWLHAKTLECRLLTGPQSTGPQFALWLADPLALYG